MNEDTSNLKNNQDETPVTPKEKVKSKKFTIDQDEWENYLSNKVVGKSFKLISAVVVPIIALLSYFGYSSISDAKKMTQKLNEEIQVKIVRVDSLVKKSENSINDMADKTREFKELQDSYKNMMNTYMSFIKDYMRLSLDELLKTNKEISNSRAEVSTLGINVKERGKKIDEKLNEYKRLEANYDTLQTHIENTLAENLQKVNELSKLVDEKLVPELILIKEGDYGVSKVANVRMKYKDADSKDFIKSLQIVDLEAKRGDNEELKEYNKPIKKDTSIVFSDLDKNKYSFKINFIESGKERKHGNYIVVEVNKVEE